MLFEDTFGGIAAIRITSAYPAGALQKIQDAGITICDVTALDTFTIRFSARRKDLSVLSKICKRRGDRIDVEGITGYIFYLYGILKRPFFLVGLCLWLFIALWIPSKILFVSVSGAEALSDNYILECAAECGIRMGATGKNIRSEEIKNALLAKIPSLQWTGINTTGCVATIHVREKETESPNRSKVAITDILSARDAVIREVTVHNGTALCQPGQAVKKGQVLISCYTDNGKILKFTGAMGEVYGETKHYLHAITPTTALKRTRILSKEENFYVILGKNPLKFQKDSGILDDSCVKMYEVKECILPGGFALPVLFVTERIIQYALEPVTLSESNYDWFSDYADTYLKSELIAGSILSKAITCKTENDLFSISGVYDCREMIADYEHKEITNYNGENS